MSSSPNVTRPLIFGSIGPYGAHLHDGSEYTGNYIETVRIETILQWHKVQIDVIVAAGVDGLAIETMPCKAEAMAVIDYVTEHYSNLKFWVSFQCRDVMSIANGDNFAETVDEICQFLAQNKHDNFIAIGMNCVSPDIVAPLLESVTRKVPFVVYPNSGETYTVEGGWVGENSCTAIEDNVEKWIGLGVRFIGGCCRTSADHVRKIRSRVADLGLMELERN